MRILEERKGVIYFILIVFTVSVLYYLTHMMNFFMYKVSFTDVLGKIYYDAGEYAPEGFSLHLFKHSPTLYSVIPSWLYRAFHINVKILMEATGFLMIFLSLLGMAFLADVGRSADRVTAFLCSAYLLFSDIGFVPLGNHWAITGQVLTASTYGIVCMMFVLAAFLKARYVLAAFLLGVTFTIHAGNAVMAGPPLVVAFIAREWRSPGWIKTLLLSAGCFLIGTAPYWIFLAREHSYVNWVAGDELKYFEYLRLSMHYHSHPSEWHPAKYITFLTFLAVGWQGRRLLRPDIRGRFSVMVGVYVAMALVFAFFTEVVPVWAIAKLSPFRLFTHLTLLFLPCYFLYLRELLVDQDRPWMGVLAAWTLGATFFSVDGPPIVPCLFLLAAPARRRVVVSMLLLCVLFSAALVILIPGDARLSSGRMLSFLYYGSYLVPTPWKIGVTIAVLAPFSVAWFRFRGPEERARLFLLFMVAFCAARGVYNVNERAAKNPRSVDYYRMQVWVLDHIPKDAGVIIDPELGGFRDFARRNVFVTWMDMYSGRLLPFVYEEVLGRFNDLTISYDELRGVRNSARSAHISERFAKLDPEVFRRIREKYPMYRYVLYVNARDPVIRLPVIHKNANFTLCEID